MEPENIILNISKLPKKVTIVEVGPRDGLQMEESIVPTWLKIEIIKELSAAGLPVIQATAFVHPGKVPQMADAEQLLANIDLEGATLLSALTLNLEGVKRACRTAVDLVEVSISASDTHGRRNAGMDFRQALDQVETMIKTVRANGRNVQASIQCAFGCVYEGHIPVQRIITAAKVMVESGADGLTLADTTGMADPVQITKVLEMVARIAGKVPLTLHLHDTRGLGMVNLLTGLEMGIDRFDTAFGGLGGCPFVPGAAGNVATEDVVNLLSRLGIETGVDIKKVALCSKRIAEFLGRFPQGRLWRLLAPGG